MTTVRPESTANLQAALQEVDVDMVLYDSFPAGDPPPWTAGMAEAGSPTVPNRNADSSAGSSDSAAPDRSD